MMKTEFDVELPWFKKKTMLADLGFLGANKDYGLESKIVLPHKKPRKSKKNPSPALTEEQNKVNKAHAQRRVVVEHAIGGMKHFHCLTHRIRNQSTCSIKKAINQPGHGTCGITYFVERKFCEIGFAMLLVLTVPLMLIIRSAGLGIQSPVILKTIVPWINHDRHE